MWTITQLKIANDITVHPVFNRFWGTSFRALKTFTRVNCTALTGDFPFDNRKAGTQAFGGCRKRRVKIP
jgi:hypothetical protein